MKPAAIMDRSHITSRYIKIKHKKYGVIDEHRAIMQDHLGKVLPRDVVVHHLNHDKHDNRIENLSTMSLADHSRMHMLACPNLRKVDEDERQRLREAYQGEGSNSAKLCNASVLKMREIYAEGKTSIRKIAKMFDVHHTTAGRAINGITFSNI